MRVKDSGYADLEAQLNVNRDSERQKSELDKKLAEATELNSRSLELNETISHVNHQLHQREAAMDALAEENKAINKATDKMEMTTDELRKTIRELLLEKDESFKKLMSLEKKIMKCRCDNI
jgi:uncharacterized coiled-coil DUF342 family protein